MVKKAIGNEEFINFICEIDGAVANLCVVINHFADDEQKVAEAVKCLRQVNRKGQQMFGGEN